MPSDDALEAFTRQLARAVHALRVRTGYRGSLETADLVQEKLAALWASPAYRSILGNRPEDLAPATRVLARNALADARRRAWVRPDLRGAVPLHDHDVADPTTDAALLGAQAHAAIAAALEDLVTGPRRARYRDPDRIAAAIRLKLAGRSDEEIAGELAVSKGKANDLVAIGLAFLTARLAEGSDG
jgi:hypothetical protein